MAGVLVIEVFSLRSACFEQICVVTSQRLLSGSYINCWYSLRYNLMSNCKSNISCVPQILLGFLHVFCSGEEKTKLSHSMQAWAVVLVWSCCCQWPSCEQPFGLKISAGITCLMIPDRLLLGIPWSLGHCIRVLSASHCSSVLSGERMNICTQTQHSCQKLWGVDFAADVNKLL